MNHTPFSSLLIANRGEIACRIIRTAKQRGLRTIAVYSEVDREAPHVLAADVAVAIGPAPARDSYLSIDALLRAAEQTGAQALHPGYGFLSENVELGRRVKEAGLVFVGPPLEALEIMGSKRLAKERMIAAGVPCVPGFNQAGADDRALSVAAQSLGFPLMIKASMGGGGKGLRRVNAESELAAKLALARAEAEAAFGDGELILERAVEKPRHVEVQVFGDQHGQVIHLGERDCSLQRRHQKVLEEAPSPAVDEALRKEMGEAAVRAAQSIGYVGAGTVEFLLGADRQFYFMEMNTRLQVEHPVTEMITGLDLVAWQLDVAAGAPLPMSQAELSLSGHAIEVRLYAEDPSAGFLPSTGRIEHLRLPTLEGVRIDHGLAEGFTISTHYDPLLAKVIAHGQDREEARRRLSRAIREIELVGPVHNREFLLEALAHPVFEAGQVTTDFLEGSDLAHLAPKPATDRDWALAAVLFGGAKAPAWSSAAPLPQPLRIERGAEVRTCILKRVNSTVEVDVGGRVIVLEVQTDGASGWVSHDGRREPFRFFESLDALHLFTAAGAFDFRRLAPGARVGQGLTEKELRSPMAGRIIEVRAQSGLTVARGEVLLVMEAMKMQLEITSKAEEIIEAVLANVGDQVDSKQVLVRFAERTGSST